MISAFLLTMDAYYTGPKMRNFDNWAAKLLPYGFAADCFIGSVLFLYLEGWVENG